MVRGRNRQVNKGNLRVRVVDDVDADESGVVALREQLVAGGVPVEVLEALEGAEDPEEIVGRLAEMGVLPSPVDALAGLLEGWRPLLRRNTTPLDAELSGAEFLGVIRAAAPQIEDLPAMLTDLCGQVEVTGAREALAMLRVLAVLGPEQVRPVAVAAADRMIATGVTDPPWVAELGRPVVGACFGYRDDTLGSQESLAVTFRYGRKEHALVVLIDHDLGGGVKDCFPTDRPDRVRVDFRQAARRFGLAFGDYSPAQAQEILSRALDAEPCPVQPDQVEDVDCYLDLLRTRVGLLADDSATDTGTVTRASKRASATVKPARTVHRVKITLRGGKPPIWRRLEVPSTIMLRDLHDAIQAAFGWAGYHLWVFETPDGDYGMPDSEVGHHDAARVTLDRVAPRTGDRIRYTYDFGDDWQHDIVVEDVLAAEPGVAYPRFVAGRRACPPEDCGGMWGYAELVDILADPEHDEHNERLEWLSLDSADEFDPATLDRDAITEALSGMARILVKAPSGRGTG